MLRERVLLVKVLLHGSVYVLVGIRSLLLLVLMLLVRLRTTLLRRMLHWRSKRRSSKWRWHVVSLEISWRWHSTIRRHAHWSTMAVRCARIVSSTRRHYVHRRLHMRWIEWFGIWIEGKLLGIWIERRLLFVSLGGWWRSCVLLLDRWLLRRRRRLLFWHVSSRRSRGLWCLGGLLLLLCGGGGLCRWCLLRLAKMRRQVGCASTSLLSATLLARCGLRLSQYGRVSALLVEFVVVHLHSSVFSHMNIIGHVL
mmetsp:Transcript_1516/g.5187  ORF Transcript_1516/g.5187 Transcript_1516/m.5187 type:complete len:253 (-) Transcript_1516:1124-1882(-)